MKIETVEKPICGSCKKIMTPLNSSIVPELFLCDHCAIPLGYGTPIQRINRNPISHLEILVDILSQNQVGMPPLPNEWRVLFSKHLTAAIGELHKCTP